MKSGGIMGWQTMQVRPHSFLQKPKIKQFYFFLFFSVSMTTTTNHSSGAKEGRDWTGIP